MAHHRLIDKDRETDVFCALCRLIRMWRDDPDKLAVAVTAYELGGWYQASYQIFDFSDDEAHDIIKRALRNRHKTRLHHLAEGMLMALNTTAEAFRFQELHGIQVDAAVIECRTFPIEERIAKLREMEEEKNAAHQAK